MDRVIGRCGNCGGNVTLPESWYDVNPPVPTCSSCGAVAKSNLPVIPMEIPEDNIDSQIKYRNRASRNVPR